MKNDIKVDIREYSVVGNKENRYVADFEYMDTQYQLIGSMEKETFSKIIENLYFYGQIA